jgi:hypothetical protein
MLPAGSDLKGLNSTYSFDYRNLRASGVAREDRTGNHSAHTKSGLEMSGVEKFFFSPVIF